MGLMKVFSGSEVLAQDLQARLNNASVETVIKNNIQTAKLPGSRTADQVVEVFIQETDFSKANPVIEEFRMSI